MARPKIRPLPWLAGAVCLIALAASLRGQAAARTVLAFLPPQRALSDEKERRLPLEWESPTELSVSLLREPSASEEMCRILEKSKSDAKERALKNIFSLNEDGKLTCTPLTDWILEIVVVDGQAATAVLYSQAAVEYLRQALAQEQLAKQDNTQLQSDLVEAEAKVKTLETEVTLLVEDSKQSGPGSRLSFMLDHYREGLDRRAHAQSRLDAWRAEVSGLSPEFFVVSGPSVSTHWSSLALAAGSLATLGLLSLSLPVLLSRFA